jgi:hypothetical protein
MQLPEPQQSKRLGAHSRKRNLGGAEKMAHDPRIIKDEDSRS